MTIVALQYGNFFFQSIRSLGLGIVTDFPILMLHFQLDSDSFG